MINRILGRREAIVDETPGVTRDRHHLRAEWRGREFELVDTGGLEPGARGLERLVVEQAEVAIESADLIVLVVDAPAGPIEDDLVVAERLRRAAKPVIVAANKVDDPKDGSAAAAFFRLGLGEPHPISALHGTGSGDFLDEMIDLLPQPAVPPDGSWASLAIVGRPNVGKSSILNSLVKSRRALVDPAPGTTRDPVDSYLDLDGERRIRIVDTAGMRRLVKIEDPIEYFSFLRARRTLERSDVALLVIDVSEGVTGHDQRIAEEIVDSGTGCVVGLNKWDLVGSDPVDLARLRSETAEKLRFVSWARTVRTSATTGRGIDRLLPAVQAAVASHRHRLATAEVNRIVRDAQEARPHPRTAGKSVRILYAVQAQAAPPTVVLFSTGAIEPTYLRYLDRRIRSIHDFEGSPLRLRYRIRSRRKVEV